MDMLWKVGKEEITKLTFEDIRQTIFNSNKNYMAKDEQIFNEIKLRMRKLFDLKELSLIEKNQFIKIIKDYIDKSLKAMNTRCPFENKIIQNFKALDIKNFSRSSWVSLIDAFPHLIHDENQILNELNRFRDLDFKEKDMAFEENDDFEIWDVWKNFENIHGKTFPNMCKLGTIVLSLPISTAAVEREFKQLKAIKTEIRSSLKSETLNSILLTKDSI